MMMNPFQQYLSMMAMPHAGIPPMKSSSSHGSKKQFVQPMIQLDNYKDESLIKEKFECLRDINDPSFRVESIKDAEFFIFRSSNDDDLHKAVKYGIWSSSPRNNYAL